jgi:hypothetical protein
LTTIDNYSCVAFLRCTAIKAETALNGVPKSLENVGRSHPKEAVGFRAATKGVAEQLRVDTSIAGFFARSEMIREELG